MCKPRNAVLVGVDRAQAIADHLAWLNGRWPSEMLRQLDRRPHDADSPIARWSLAHSRRLAVVRFLRYRTPGKFRLDYAPPLIDDLSDAVAGG